MVVNRKPTGRSMSIPGGLSCGLAAEIASILLGLAIIAGLIDAEKLEANNMGYGIMTTIMVSSWLGATVACKKIKRMKLMICLMSAGLCFMTLLLATALFFGAKYYAVGETGLLIMCGSMLAAMGGRNRKSKAGQGKIRIPNG